MPKILSELILPLLAMATFLFTAVLSIYLVSTLPIVILFGVVTLGLSVAAVVYMKKGED